MTDMEQRAWITIENFPAANDDAAWEPFAAALERHAGEFGPVLSWEDTTTVQVVMSADVDERAQFAQAAVARVTDALRSASLGELYPSAIDIHPIADDEPIAA